ncbi:MAG: hypothetical protein M3Z75_13405, partial [Actinomycetota bacterium]|nr:hypothetical protein [Actinomycetota bacterium]
AHTNADRDQPVAVADYDQASALADTNADYDQASALAHTNADRDQAIAVAHWDQALAVTDWRQSDGELYSPCADGLDAELHSAHAGAQAQAGACS